MQRAGFLCSMQIQFFKVTRVKEEAQWIENSKVKTKNHNV